MHLPAVIGVDKEKCVNCHACISACPVKYCNDGSKDYVVVNADTCIGCGNCLAACTHMARQYLDDFSGFLTALSLREKVVAIVAPSVVANFPGEYLNLNGWLKDSGVEAIFDVSFGAELTIKSLHEYLKTQKPQAMIAHPCPAIVSYIELYRPELIKHLVPVFSPMLHTIKMIRKFYPAYSDHKIVAISPCLAKKREFAATGLGDYNVAFLSIDRHVKSHGLTLDSFPQVPFDNPPAERAVLFSSPGGLLQTAERLLPGIRHETRKIEGTPLIYGYLKDFATIIQSGKNPLLVDCLSCEQGCNGGPLTLARQEGSPHFEEMEFQVRKRAGEAREIYKTNDQAGPGASSEEIEAVIGRYWEEGLYARTYTDLSHHVAVKEPTPDELSTILRSMHKNGEKDLYNCTSCGYNSCKSMATAIFNQLNRPENCHFFLSREAATSHQRLQESEARYRQIVETTREGIWTLNADWRTTFANSRMAQMLGCTVSEMMGRKFTDFLFSEDLREHEGQVWRRIRGESGKYERRLRCADGSTLWCLISAVALHDGQGHFTGSLAMLTDITDRKTAEHQLVESETLLKEIIDSTGDLIGAVDARSFCVRSFNRGCQDFFGRWRGIQIRKGMPLEELFTEPVFFDRWQGFFRKALREGPFTQEYSVLDGAMTLEMSFRLLLRNDVVFGISIFGKNITEQKRAMEALQESETRNRLLFDVSPDGIVLIGPDGCIMRSNIAQARMFGYDTPNDLIGIHATQLVARSSRDHSAQILRRRLNGETIPPVEYELVRRDETTFYGETSAAILRNADDEIDGYICVTRDTTERRRAEKERFDLESQLQQAQKMESVGRLAGGVAHDFNNILSVINGYTELALDKVNPSDPLHDNLKEVLAAGRRSAEITHQLLAFARKQAVAPEVLDMNEAVESMLKLLRRLIGEDIDLAWLPENLLWNILIDPSQLEQILANLCVNARDAIAGIGKITIETHSVTFDEAYCAEHPGFIPGEFALLAVSDDGCGMEKDTIGRIFEPFFTTKDVNHGTGLGLATVFGIVKQNNGFINVYSEPNQGTTFKIYLPRHVGEVQKASETVVEIPSARGELILLVEDDPAIRKMTQTMLERLGYTILTAGSASEAFPLAEAHAGQINLLITDVVMPGMSGRDLAEILHARSPTMQILFMSGYTSDVIAHRGLLAEGVQLLQKPFSLKTIGFKIREILDSDEDR